jgi:prolyl-tRNA synthetase
MTHSDDKGLVLPPRVAPIHVMILPIFKAGAEEKDEIMQRVRLIADAIRAWPAQKANLGTSIQVQIDTDETKSAGWKFHECEVQGIPVRIEIGPKDLAKEHAVLVRRDTGEKAFVGFTDIPARVVDLLTDIQNNLFEKAVSFREKSIHDVDNYEDFKKTLDEKGGFIRAHWDGTAETEAKIKEETKATIRCLPNDAEDEPGKCVVTGKSSSRRVLFARAY